MDLIEATIQRFHEQSAEHKATRLAQIGEMRAQEELLSKKRLAELQRVEQERQTALHLQRKEQQRRDIYAMMFVGSVGVCVLVIGLWIIFFA